MLEGGPLGGIASTGPLVKTLHLPPGLANTAQVALHPIAFIQRPCCVLTLPGRASSDCIEGQIALVPVQEAYWDFICYANEVQLVLPYLHCLLVQHDLCELSANVAVSANDMRIHFESCCFPEEHGRLGWMQLMGVMNELLKLHRINCCLWGPHVANVPYADIMKQLKSG